MPNPNLFYSGADTYNIDAVIKGQTPLTYYDPLKQIAYQPSISRGADGKIKSVLPYPYMGLWGLFAQLNGVYGSDKKTVMSRKFWWAEYDMLQTFAFAVSKSANAIPAGGVAVTVSISRASLNQSGLFAKPLAGYTALVKENNRQVVTVTNVTETSAGNITVTLAPINGEVLNLTRLGQYTIVLAGMKNYHLSATADIQTQGIVKAPPALYPSAVQKYELGFEEDESEIDNYVYDKDIMLMKGLDARGNPMEYYYIPSLSTEMEGRIIENRIWRTLFNRKNLIADEDFDGIVPTIEKYGLFNYAYDVFIGGSFKSLLFSMIKSIRKVNGSNDYMLIHDFNFGIDWSNAMAQLVRNNDQSYRYELFGEGGVGIRDFEYFQFKNFRWANYNFIAYQMDAFDNYQLGRPLEYFAMLCPAKTRVDTDGNRVAPLTYVNVKGAELAKDQEVWVDDARKRGGRGLRIFGKDSFGIEITSPSQWGMITRGNVSQ